MDNDRVAKRCSSSADCVEKKRRPLQRDTLRLFGGWEITGWTKGGGLSNGYERFHHHFQFMLMQEYNRMFTLRPFERCAHVSLVVPLQTSAETVFSSPLLRGQRSRRSQCLRQVRSVLCGLLLVKFRF